MYKVDSVSILAGGGGTRLWPASTEQHPKQFMKVAASKSLLLQTIERSWALQPALGVFVICNQRHLNEIHDEIAQLPAEQVRKTYVMSEPFMRNTATALFYANLLIEELAGPQTINLVQTSDHLVGEFHAFNKTIDKAVALAQTQRIVVFGIKPLYPATGYGYIERSTAILEIEEGFQVERFTEKPTLEEAQEFIASGKYYWNSGMFCYPVGLFCKELTALTPNIPAAFGDFKALRNSFIQQLEVKENAILLQPSAQLEAAYNSCESISVDYALMEKTKKLALLPANFDWNDIGSWDVLSTLEPSSTLVVEVGQSGGNFVRSSLPVALCNVGNLIVVEENGVLLICEKGSTELVKQARTCLIDLIQEQRSGQSESYSST